MADNLYSGWLFPDHHKAELQPATLWSFVRTQHMKATAYLAGYALAMYLDQSAIALGFFCLLFRSLFIKWLIQCKLNWVRAPLVTFMLPFTLIDYLVTTARFAPRELRTFRPYTLVWTLYLMQVRGQFTTVPRKTHP